MNSPKALQISSGSDVSKNLNEKLMDRILRHHARFQQYTAGEAKKVNDLIAEMQDDILDQVQRRYEKALVRGRDAGPETTRRLEELYTVTQRINTEAFRRIRDGVKEANIEVTQDEIDFVQDTLKNEAQIDVDLNIPSQSLLLSIATTEPIDGTPLNKWYSKLSSDTQTKINRAVRLSAAEGQTVDQLVQRIRGTRANNFSDGIIQTTTRNAEAIARTSLNNVANKTRMETYKANSDLIKGYQWVATLDSKTCLVCGGLDKKVWKPDEQAREAPAHINCRCTIVSVLKSYSDIGVKNVKERAPKSFRESMDGAVPRSMSYDQWLKTQPEDFQRDILGPKRFELYKSGKVRLTSFTDRKGHTLTLDRLAEKEGRKKANKPTVKKRADKVIAEADSIAENEITLRKKIRDPRVPIQDRVAAYTELEGESLRRSIKAQTDKQYAEIKRLEAMKLEVQAEKMKFMEGIKPEDKASDYMSILEGFTEQQTKIQEQINSFSNKAEAAILKAITSDEKGWNVKAVGNRIGATSKAGYKSAKNADIKNLKDDKNRANMKNGIKFFERVTVLDNQFPTKNKTAKLKNALDADDQNLLDNITTETERLREKSGKVQFYYISKYQDQRAHHLGGVWGSYQKTGFIGVPIKYTSQKSTYVHELGHFYDHVHTEVGQNIMKLANIRFMQKGGIGAHKEYVNPNVLYRNYRTKNTEDVILNDLFPNYNFKRIESGNSDDWTKLFKSCDKDAASPYYTGKKYETTIAGESAELTSMYIELLSEPDNVLKFIEHDPEGFDFIMGYLRGVFQMQLEDWVPEP